LIASLRGNTAETSPRGKAAETSPRGKAVTVAISQSTRNLQEIATSAMKNCRFPWLPRNDDLLLAVDRGQAAEMSPRGQAAETSPRGQAAETSPRGQAAETSLRGNAVTVAISQSSRNPQEIATSAMKNWRFPWLPRNDDLLLAVDRGYPAPNRIFPLKSVVNCCLMRPFAFF
jgi:hypothetical protein